MTKFTPDEIVRLRELAANATPRPWKYDLIGEFVQGDGHHLAQTWNKYEEDFDNAQANGTYIVAAANAMPAALDEIERLRVFIKSAIASADKSDMLIILGDALKGGEE